MTKKFLIAGSIVDTDADRETYEDVTPAQINAFIKNLADDDDIELDITSYGGSVTAGLAICNLLKQASSAGHKTCAHVIGIAASMASAIACACDELKIDSNSLCMLHLPWTMTVGNAVDLRKEADVLDQYRDALVSIYRTKFALDDNAIVKILQDETWLTGNEASAFKLNCTVIPTEAPLKIAASGKMPKFMHTPKALKEIIMEKEAELINKDNIEIKDDVVVLPVKADIASKIVDEAMANVEAEAKAEVEVKAEDMVPKAEVDKRVSGMQSTMAKQMDAMKKDYEAKIADFEVQMKAKDQELAQAKADATSLVQKLEEASRELSEKTSALEAKENALATLNASVNTPAQAEKTKPWKELHGDELLKWCRENPTIK